MYSIEAPLTAFLLEILIIPAGGRLLLPLVFAAQAIQILLDIDIKGITPGPENAELLVQVDINARRLDAALVQRLDDDPLLGDLLSDCAIAEHHV